MMVIITCADVAGDNAAIGAQQAQRVEALRELQAGDAAQPGQDCQEARRRLCLEGPRGVHNQKSAHQGPGKWRRCG